MCYMQYNMNQTITKNQGQIVNSETIQDQFVKNMTVGSILEKVRGFLQKSGQGAIFPTNFYFFIDFFQNSG
jgi:hypothetical protein